MFAFRKIIRIALAVVSMNVLAACASGPTFKETRASELAVAPGLTRIYFYRVDTMAGVGFQLNISIDGVPIGSMLPGGYFYEDKPPGSYEISTTRLGQKDSTKITVKQGETRYIRFDLVIGFFGGHLIPTPVSTELGKSEIANSKFDKVAP